MSGHWGHKGSWALCFQKHEKKQNKTTSSVGIIKSEFLKWLKEMSSYRKHCSHKEKLENIKVLTEELPPAPPELACKCCRVSNVEKVDIKCSHLSPSHITEVLPSTGKRSPALCHLPFPQLIHSCEGTCTQREMISLTMVGTSVSCEFEPWNGSHRQSPCWWRADTRWRSLELLHWLRQLLVWDAGM